MTRDLDYQKSIDKDQVNVQIETFSDPFVVIDMSKSTIKNNGLDLVFTDTVMHTISKKEPVIIETKEDYTEFNAAAASAITGKSLGGIA